jgi:hypothetical protein
MSAEYERRLLARARELADLDDIKDDVLQCLGGARHAGLDPDAITGLVGCAAALGAVSTATYSAGDGWSGQHADERAFLGHVSSIEDDIEERLHAAANLGEQAMAALDAAQNDLEDAQAMSVTVPCDGCHNRRDAAIRDCQARIAICGQVIQMMGELAMRLRHALARLRAVPSDLGETYESVYNLIRRRGRMPHEGRWITGEEVPA